MARSTNRSTLIGWNPVKKELKKFKVQVFSTEDVNLITLRYWSYRVIIVIERPGHKHNLIESYT